MSVNPVSEDDLYAALRPNRVDADAFELAVRQRLTMVQKQRAADPLARLSPLLKCAAAFLPIEILAGCRVPSTATKLAPAGGAYKLLSYLAFPAISLFVLLGATIFSISKIRRIQNENDSELSNQDAIREATHEWWRRHKWGAIAVFVATLTLMVVGATWILFLFYLISFGLLVIVLGTFAKLGLGNRQMIGQSCLMGLMFLAQATMMVGIGDQEIHFVDQKLVSAIFLIGVLGLVPFVMGNSQLAGPRVEKFPRWIWVAVVAQVLVTLLLVGVAWSFFHSVLLVAILLVGALVPVATTVYRARMAGQRMERVPQRLALGLMVILLLPLLAWLMNSVLWPTTPSRIKHYVESFEDDSPLAVVRWRHWEIVARWAIESNLDPDLTHPRRLLAEEISGKQDRFILSSALRTGLLSADQVGQLKEYEELRRSLVVVPPGVKPQVISSLAQFDWVIRASVLHNDLSPQERDVLEKRLHVTLEELSKSPFDQSDVLETALRVTQLLDLIERPIDRDQYRGQIHGWLRKFHSTKGGGFQLAGGFKQYLASPVGSLETTSHGVELMEIYGYPDGLDLNWVRAFLRPLSYRPMDERWMAAATLDRLNHLPGVTRPTWLEVMYYERTLLAAAVLAGLCIYATVSSPKLKTTDPANSSS
jgi:hypothetical protein